MLSRVPGVCIKSPRSRLTLQKESRLRLRVQTPDRLNAERDSANDGDRVSMLFCRSPIPLPGTRSVFQPCGRQNPVTLNHLRRFLSERRWKTPEPKQLWQPRSGSFFAVRDILASQILHRVELLAREERQFLRRSTAVTGVIFQKKLPPLPVFETICSAGLWR